MENTGMNTLVNVETPGNVTVDFLDKVKQFPMLITPISEDGDLFEWVKQHKDFLHHSLLKHGSILFRGFNLNGIDDFRRFTQMIDKNLIDYKERSSPRHEVADKIYTSTDHPADQEINMHNENSYSRSWPLKILFFCLIPSVKGGETPVADSRKVLEMLSETTRNKFIEKGILYVRNLGGVLGLDWREVFQTDNQAEVEAYCRKNEMNFEWRANGTLRLSYQGPAVRTHPETKEKVWFNHGFFFNILSLDPVFVEEILTVMDKDEFSFLSYYGDGTEIEASAIAEIKTIYKELSVKLKWQKGDLLLQDNMLAAHGRSPYEGDRKVVVAMSEPQYYADYK